MSNAVAIWYFWSQMGPMSRTLMFYSISGEKLSCLGLGAELGLIGVGQGGQVGWRENRIKHLERVFREWLEHWNMASKRDDGGWWGRFSSGEYLQCSCRMLGWRCWREAGELGADGGDAEIKLWPWQWMAQMESIDGTEEIKKPTGQDLGGFFIYGCYGCQELWQ